MFTKININQFGPYSRFRWQQKMKPFSRVNIIYGRNYSGKTTLSRIFDCVAQGTLHKDYAHGQFSLITSEGVELTTAHLQCDERVRVYNSDFVSRNLSWLRNEEQGTIQPFALIGSENVEAQREIDRIDELLQGTKGNIGLVKKQELLMDEYENLHAAIDDNDKLMERQYNQEVNAVIKLDPYFVKLGDEYTIDNLREEMEEVLAQKKYTPLTKNQFDLQRRIVDDEQKKDFNVVSNDDRQLWEPISMALKLVTKRITLSKAIEDLLEDDLLQAWANQGRELHKDRTTCAFCGNPISEERRNQLDMHFSMESISLKKSLTELKQQLKNVDMLMNNYLIKIGFDNWKFYSELYDDYVELLYDWDSYKWYLNDAVNRIMPLIDLRLAEITKPIDVDPRMVSNLRRECNDKFRALVRATNMLMDRNEAYSLILEKKKQDARDRLRMNEVYRFCNTINYTGMKNWERKNMEQLHRMKKELKVLAKEINKLEEQRQKWELAKKDESKAAGKVTELLVNHFGHGSLTLEAVQEPEWIDIKHQDTIPAQTRFVIKRGGEEAHNLSDGEKSLISFCYFIAQIEAELNSPEASKLVIFIDDPISSLDNSHIFFMYSLIESLIAAPQRYGQLFISTHNLDFLKYLKRLTVPTEPRRSDNIAHYVIVKERFGDGEYRSRIAEMPPYLRDYVTEYNFLFSQIYQMAQPPARGGDKRRQLEHSYTQYYNIGNNMRRFLECYLFMRYPNADEPMRHLPKLFGHGYVPAEVNRIVNEYSHLAFALRGGSVMEVPEVEAAARHILTALRTRDPEHYAALCESINVKNT